MPGGVVLETAVRPAAPAAALVEKHDTVFARIEEAPHPRFGAAAGSSVQEHCGLTSRIAALLEVDAVMPVDVQVVPPMGLDRGVQRL